MKEINAKSLSQLRYLKREIEIERERLAELRAAAEYGRRGDPSGVRGKAVSDRTGALASEIAYLSELIAQNMRRCICELLRMQSFINAVEDSEMRIILRERYIKGRSWLSTAFTLGYCDEQVPRRKHDRFLKAHNARCRGNCKAVQRSATAAKEKSF